MLYRETVEATRNSVEARGVAAERAAGRTAPPPRTASGRRLFVFGLGYTGLRFARALRGEGWRVAGTTTDPARAAALAAEGIDVVRFDRAHPLPAEGLAALASADAVLVSVPPEEAGDPVLAVHGPHIAAARGLRWLGYLSTTGVYGDRQGGWVDESSPLRPTGPRGARRVEAEAGWLGLWRAHGVPVHVFRLAGIYGPGRSALDAVRRGEARRIVKPGQVFSRIHVDDLVAVLRASLARPRPGVVYNVCDDEPAPPEAVVEHACRLLGVPPPPAVPFEAAALSPMARSFYADSKRVSNARIKTELGIRLRHPTYREGLAAILAEAV
ncbi:MAG: SDR family oxidoreductase [Rhodospirillaceae bacterium]|nr:SDR family oxidoreductase [Rhodospirillaceae bacterium]